ncbi:MAG: hypothetical protein H7Y02_01880 [Candidatus Obscuribacterales bacterium]|nr:hypothetical protein [Steroidobacteraceae bacterium]
MNQPSFGLDFTVKMEAGWAIKRVSIGAVAWQGIIKSEHIATTGDAVAGVARLLMANQGAARNNIALGLAKIIANYSRLLQSTPTDITLSAPLLHQANAISSAARPRRCWRRDSSRREW